MATQPDGGGFERCPGDLHTVCCHLLPSISDASDGSPRLEWDAGGALCTCPCHAECPLAASGTSSEWPDGCSCPGTVAHLRRQSRASSSLGETLRTSVEKSRREKKAKEELRRRASGRSVEEVDQMIDDIWPMHGLPAPVGPARPWIIDHARNPPGYAAQVRMTGDILAGSGRFISGIVGRLREASTTEPEDTVTEPPYFSLQTDNDAVEVILDEGRQGLVASQTDGIFTSRLLSTVRVALRRDGDSVEVWTRGGTRHGSPVRLGTVPREDCSRYLPLLRAAERVEQEVVCPALRAEAPEGTWHLYVKLPQSTR